MNGTCTSVRVRTGGCARTGVAACLECHELPIIMNIVLISILIFEIDHDISIGKGTEVVLAASGCRSRPWATCRNGTRVVLVLQGLKRQQLQPAFAVVTELVHQCSPCVCDGLGNEHWHAARGDGLPQLGVISTG